MFRLGSEGWEIYRRGECTDCRPITRLHDRFAARQWLQQFRSNALSMNALRHMLTRESSVSWRLDRASDDELIDQAAQLLGFGVWHVHDPVPIHGRPDRQRSTAGPSTGKASDAPSAKQQPPDSARTSTQTVSLAEEIASVAKKVAPAAPKLTWIEIELVNAEGKPVAGADYEIKLADGTVKRGKLDAKGKARHEQIEPGKCQVSFPDFDGNDWQRA